MPKKKKKKNKAKAPLGYRRTQGRCPDCGKTLFERDTAGIPIGHAYACLNEHCDVSPRFGRSDIKEKMEKQYSAERVEQRRKEHEDYLAARSEQNLVTRWLEVNRPDALGRFPEFSKMVIWALENRPGAVTQPQVAKPIQPPLKPLVAEVEDDGNITVHPPLNATQSGE